MPSSGRQAERIEWSGSVPGASGTSVVPAASVVPPAADPRLTGLFGAPYARNAGAPGEPPSVQEVLQLLG